MSRHVTPWHRNSPSQVRILNDDEESCTLEDLRAGVVLVTGSGAPVRNRVSHSRSDVHASFLDKLCRRGGRSRRCRRG